MECPEDLWVEILCRLPRKDLIRCQIVSKTWYQFIAGVCIPRFWPKNSLSGLYFSSVRWFFRFPGRSCISFMQGVLSRRMRRSADNSLINYVRLEDMADADCESNKQLGEIRCEMSYSDLLPFRPQTSLGSSNGLLLFLNESTRQYYVCNPLTRQSVAVPKAHEQRLHSCAALAALDPAESSHYKVVRFSVSDSREPVLDIFSSNFGEWTEHKPQFQFDSIDLGDWSQFRPSTAYSNGVLYRLSMFHILRIDLNVVNVRLIELPEVERGGKIGFFPVLVKNRFMGVSTGRLHYSYELNFQLRIWFLEDYGESSEWILKYSIGVRDLQARLDNLDVSRRWLEPFGFHPKSDCIFLATPHMILSYDLKSHRLKSVCKRTGEFVFPIFMCCSCSIPLKELSHRNRRSTTS